MRAQRGSLLITLCWENEANWFTRLKRSVVKRMPCTAGFVFVIYLRDWSDFWSYFPKDLAPRSWRDRRRIIIFLLLSSFILLPHSICKNPVVMRKWPNLPSKHLGMSKAQWKDYLRGNTILKWKRMLRATTSNQGKITQRKQRLGNRVCILNTYVSMCIIDILRRGVTQRWPPPAAHSKESNAVFLLVCH